MTGWIFDPSIDPSIAVHSCLPLRQIMKLLVQEQSWRALGRQLVWIVNNSLNAQAIARS
jgi:hypothetical protein